MCRSLFNFFALVLFFGPSSLIAADSVAAFFNPDDPEGRSLVLSLLEDRGVRCREIDSLIAEDKLKLSRFEVLWVGPRATQSRVLTDWIRGHGEEMRSFVAKGGMLVTFLQSPDFWDIEPWLPWRSFVLRRWELPVKVVSIEERHPLFSRPHTFSSERLTEILPRSVPGGGSIERANHGLVLARDGHGRPWCVELGWGKGRVLLLAWAPPTHPDEAKDEGRDLEAAQRIASYFAENVLQYALDCAGGKAHPLADEILVCDWSAAGRLDPALYSAAVEKVHKQGVNAAVDRGIAYLKAQQKPNGSWGPYGASNGQYKVGPTAIALLALLVSGVNKHESFIMRGFDWMLYNPPEMTYEIGLAMMALEHKAAPMYERFELERMTPEERKRFRYRRDLSDKERGYMQACRDRLLDRHVRGGLWAYRPGLGDGDISNGQYAILGLKAARRCGLAVPREIWKEGLEFFLRHQQSSGTSVVVPRFRKIASDGTLKFTDRRAEARGWSYSLGGTERLGSHACIGMACILLCYEELMANPGPKGGAHATKVREAVRDGTAWLFGYWSIDHVPQGEKFYYYYYIYSLERVGVLTEQRFIGDRDWYREGARYLMAKQNRDGSWSSRGGEWGTPIANSAFALLFLKRSTPPPVITLGH